MASLQRRLWLLSCGILLFIFNFFDDAFYSMVLIVTYRLMAHTCWLL